MRGIEPPRCHHHRLLRPARLPVPPHPRKRAKFNIRAGVGGVKNGPPPIPDRRFVGALARAVYSLVGFDHMTAQLHTRTGLAERLSAIITRITECAVRAGRRPEDVRLIAVSKTHPVETIREALAAGVTDLGENRVQEAEPKIEAMGHTQVRWHLIGPLQANKARRAVKLFDVIHTLDSIDLAQRLDRICREEQRAELPVLIQLSLANEATKSGVAFEQVEGLVNAVRQLDRLRLIGLMTMPPFEEDPERTRPYFHQLREIRDRLAAAGAFGGSIGELSMGMSHDHEVAIEEGATLVRIGTAIFGERIVG